MAYERPPIPSCPVCGRDPEPYGGFISSRLDQQGFSCLCGGFATLVCNRGGNLLSYFRPDQVTPLDGGRVEFPPEWGKWANEVVLPTWRDRAERLDDHRHVEWRKWIAEVFHPAFPDLNYPEKVNYYDLPDGARALIAGQFGKNLERIGSYLPLPLDLQDAAMPPRAPAGFVMYYKNRKGEWLRVDPEVSATLPVPEDPILRHDREFFAAVWEAVGRELGVALPEGRHVKNEYGGIQPWRAFEFGGATFVLGWRKRVVSIRVRSEKAISTAAIRKVAIGRDDVTFEAYGGLEAVEFSLEELLKECPGNAEILRKMYPDGVVRRRDGGWKSAMPQANEICVHAWTSETCIEYLTILCREVLG